MSHRIGMLFLLMTVATPETRAEPPIDVYAADLSRVTITTSSTGVAKTTSWGNLKFTVKDDKVLRGLLDAEKTVNYPVVGELFRLELEFKQVQQLVQEKFLTAEERDNIVVQSLDKLKPADVKACLYFCGGKLFGVAYPERFQAAIVVNAGNAQRISELLGRDAITDSLFRINGQPRGGKINSLAELVRRIGPVNLTGTRGRKELKLTLDLSERQSAVLKSLDFMMTESESLELKAPPHLEYALELLQDKNKKEEGKKRLQRIITDFPGTKTAERAQRILENLK